MQQIFSPSDQPTRAARTKCQARTREERPDESQARPRGCSSPQPTLLLADVRLQEDGMDELRLRFIQQQEIGDGYAHIFAEAALCHKILDRAVALERQAVFSHDGIQDSVSASLMLGAQMQSRWMDSVCQMLNF